MFAVGFALGLAGGWWASNYAHAPQLLNSATANAQPAPMAAAPAAPPPDVAPEVPPPPEAPPPATDAAQPFAPDAAAAPEATAPPPSPPPEAESSAAPEDDETRAAPPAPRACATQQTPADRVICSDPKLQKLQRELQRAYAQALAAHEDRALLREHQLAWRAERDEIADPDRLARFYEDRIRKLNAATADAERQR